MVAAANLEGDAEFEELGFQLAVVTRASRSACITAREYRRTSWSSPASARS